MPGGDIHLNLYIVYPFPKPLLSIKFDIFDIIFDTSGLSHRRSLSRSRKAPQYCNMRVGTHVHAGACVRHRMWSTCCAPARAAHGPSVHIKHTYGRPPSSTRRRQPARGTCRLASSSACHAYSSPSPSSQHSSLVPALGVEVHQAVLVRASAGSSNPCGRASCGRPSSRSRRPRASSPTRQVTRRQPRRARLRARRIVSGRAVSGGIPAGRPPRLQPPPRSAAAGVVVGSSGCCPRPRPLPRPRLPSCPCRWRRSCGARAPPPAARRRAKPSAALLQQTNNPTTRRRRRERHARSGRGRGRAVGRSHRGGACACCTFIIW